MNTKHEAPEQNNDLSAPPENKSDDATGFAGLLIDSTTPSKTDVSAEVLERALRHQADERRTERFFWILGVMILVDMLVFPSKGVGFISSIFVLEVLALIGLANWLDVDWVKKPLMQLWQRSLRLK